MAEMGRIEIQKDGPYVVHGGVPLKEMAPVHTLNGEPVAWHTLQELGTPGPSYELCRCGKSQNKPFCDSSHERLGFDGEETASRDPMRQRSRTWERGDEVLADDGTLCMSAGFCKTRTRTVWKLFEEAEGDERQEMREMVWRCPSGRLALFGPDGFPLESDRTPEIAVVPGGPLWVRGGIPITDANGGLWEPRNRVTLCRCGASRDKPFCDGSHSAINFDER